MQRPSDEILIAYLDGELVDGERRAVMQALAADGALRAHAERLNDGARLIRAAYDGVLRESVPERLIAAARGEAGIKVFARLIAQQAALNANFGSSSWLDNIAAYHKLFVNAEPNDRQLMDVPADDSGNAIRKAAQLPADFRLPHLKPWGLDFQGARI